MYYSEKLSPKDKKRASELRKKYMENPPEGLSKSDISRMSDSDILDIDYFLNEDEDDIFSDEDFILFDFD